MFKPTKFVVKFNFVISDDLSEDIWDGSYSEDPDDDVTIVDVARHAEQFAEDKFQHEIVSSGILANLKDVGEVIWGGQFKGTFSADELLDLIEKIPSVGFLELPCGVAITDFVITGTSWGEDVPFDKFMDDIEHYLSL